MFQIKNRLLLVISCALFLNPMYAASRAPKIVIDEGGFTFQSSYKLQIPSSPGISPSELVVNAVAGCDTTVTQSYSGPICCGSFGMSVYFPFNDSTVRITTMALGNRRQAIFRETNITPSSIWYPALNKLLTRLGSQLDPYRSEKKKYSILRKPKIHSPSTSFVHIEPLPGSTLYLTYSMRIASRLPMNSSLAERVLVDVTMEEKVVEGHGNRKALVAKAVFYTKRHATTSDPKSTIEFIKTKNGLQEISRTNIKSSSIWYPWVEKVIEESVSQYDRCKNKHLNIFSHIRISERVL